MKIKARYHHIKFFRLAIGDTFFIGNVVQTKRGYFSALSVLGEPARIMPWHKVRSCKPITSAAKAKAEVARTIEFPCYPPTPMGCQGDGDAGGDRSCETIGGNEKTPSA